MNTRYNNRQSLFLLWSCILNQQMKGTTAISNAKLLMERLGLDRPEFPLDAISHETLRAAFFQKPQIHRFGETMCKYLCGSLATLLGTYGGEPCRVFSNLTEYADLCARLSVFSGIGAHKIKVTCAVLSLLGNTISCDEAPDCPGLETGVPLYAEILSELA